MSLLMNPCAWRRLNKWLDYEEFVAHIVSGGSINFVDDDEDGLWASNGIT